MSIRKITITDVSDEPQYTIKAVSKQTGILPVTIRAWERRFQLLKPQRAENRYRMYSERDVLILKWIQGNLNRGVSISKAVSNLKANLEDGILPVVASETEQQPAAVQAHAPAAYAERLYQALVAHDDVTASQLLQEAHAVFDLVIVFEQIILPCMYRVGDAWQSGKMSITSEHVASSFIRGKLMTLLNAYPNRRTSKVVLVGCAPFEQHEIGTLMLAILLRRSGLRVDYLGPDVPLDDLLEYAREEHPAMILLSATLEQNALELVGFEQRLSVMKHAPVFAYGGSCFNASPALREKVQGEFLGSTLLDAVEYAHSLVK